MAEEKYIQIGEKGRYSNMDAERKQQVLRTLNYLDEEIRDSTAQAICRLLIGKGFSFRQAEALLDYAKILLKEAKI